MSDVTIASNEEALARGWMDGGKFGCKRAFGCKLPASVGARHADLGVRPPIQKQKGNYFKGLHPRCIFSDSDAKGSELRSYISRNRGPFHTRCNSFARDSWLERRSRSLDAPQRADEQPAQR